MMTREDRQEALSLAYVKAVAAFSGMTYSFPSKDYGIELCLHQVEREEDQFSESGFHLDLQIKSTTVFVETRKSISYDLSIKAYDKLRAETNQARILALFILPPNEVEWLRQKKKSKLELRKCVYWTSLRGQPKVQNRSSIRVTIPKRQLFTPDSLKWIMERLRAKESLS